MPFRSPAQRRWMYATHPAMAQRWSLEQGGMVSIDATDLGRLDASLGQKASMAPEIGSELTRQMAEDLVKLVKEHASGRPGPQVVTGAYRDSIHIMDNSGTGNISQTIVGTMAPQALRLEYGYVGIDALGRHYAQPPFPHWRPAVLELQQNSGKYMKVVMEMMK